MLGSGDVGEERSTQQLLLGATSSQSGRHHLQHHRILMRLVLHEPPIGLLLPLGSQPVIFFHPLKGQRCVAGHLSKLLDVELLVVFPLPILLPVVQLFAFPVP
jgi:hypothetical protein